MRCFKKITNLPKTHHPLTNQLFTISGPERSLRIRQPSPGKVSLRWFLKEMSRVFHLSQELKLSYQRTECSVQPSLKTTRGTARWSRSESSTKAEAKICKNLNSPRFNRQIIKSAATKTSRCKKMLPKKSSNLNASFISLSTIQNHFQTHKQVLSTTYSTTVKLQLLPWILTRATWSTNNHPTLSQQTWQPQPLRTFNKCEIYRLVVVLLADQMRQKAPQKFHNPHLNKPHPSRWSKTGSTVLVMLTQQPSKKMQSKKVAPREIKVNNRVIVRSKQVWLVQLVSSDPWLSNSLTLRHTLLSTTITNW